jgi:paraquat-inducible protein B
MPELSTEDYKAIVERVTSDLFHANETFRKTVVHREMSAIALRWVAVFGAVNVVALVGIYFSVKASMQQAVADEAKNVVKSQTDWAQTAVKEVTSTAVTQVAAMQESLAESNRKLADTLKQADDVKKTTAQLQRKQQELSTALNAISTNSAWLNDPENVERTAAFVKMVSSEHNLKLVSDLKTAVVKMGRAMIWREFGPGIAPSKVDEYEWRTTEMKRLLEQIDMLERVPQPSAPERSPKVVPK